MTKAYIMASWDDVPHLSAADKTELLESIPPHERDVRSKGIPTLGSGLVYPHDEDSITFDLFALPRHWPRIAAIDFGWEDPTAVVWGAWDRDADSVYIYDEYYVNHQTPVIHAAAIKAKGAWIPMAWPADGLQTEKGSGIQLARQYRDQGVNMLPEFSQYPDTVTPKETEKSRVSKNAGVMDIHDRLTIGKLKIARHLTHILDEKRMYHRKNGLIVDGNDHAWDAVRYLIMSLRFAVCQSANGYGALSARTNPRAI